MAMPLAAAARRSFPFPVLGQCHEAGQQDAPASVSPVREAEQRRAGATPMARGRTCSGGGTVPSLAQPLCLRGAGERPLLEEAVCEGNEM